MHRLLGYYGVPLNNKAVSHIAISLLRDMQGAHFTTQLFGLSSESACYATLPISSPPKLLSRILWRMGGNPCGFAESHYLKKLRPGDVAYLWPSCSIGLYENVKRKKCIIVNERINCHRSARIELLASAHRDAGIPLSRGIPQALVDAENRKLALSDFIFSPSPCVTNSLIDAQVPNIKILESTYGYCPNRIAASSNRNQNSELNFLYLGSGCVRKGIHTLLDAWINKPFRANLLIAGKIDENIRDKFSHVLQRPDVELLGHVDDIAGVLARSDVFVFPTYEEGSPLVIYEAAAAGLPILTTDMGAGSVIRADCECLLVSAGNVAQLVEAMSRLATDPSLRNRLGLAARVRAKEFTWARVAEKRAAMLAQRLLQRSSLDT